MEPVPCLVLLGDVWGGCIRVWVDKGVWLSSCFMAVEMVLTGAGEIRLSG